MAIADAFASIALSVSAAIGAGFHSAVARWPGTATFDDGGSIAVPGTPVEKTCSAQVDAATEAMRLQEGYRDTDVRLLVLAATLDGELDTNASVELLAGPHAGAWSLESVTRDPAGLCWEARGRRA